MKEADGRRITLMKIESIEDFLPRCRVLNHSAIRISGNPVIYFDPFELERHETRHDAGIIFITHDHYDHFSPEDIDRMRRPETVFVIPESIHENFLAAGISETKLVTVNPNEKHEVSGIKFETVPAYNILKPFHPKGNLWVGYVVTIDGVRCYIAGDTDQTRESLAVKCDIAFVPVGGTYTMNAREAAQLVNKIQPRAAFPTHYGSVVGMADDAEIFREELDSQIEYCR